ncbi:sensor histidine kinase [Sulfurospirillum arcachonense]|uniref:sensor histidine kinase n=1 Tax=Sulfurospirillum arcachonense TaxID=57666 RepID=UPI00046A503D|nr:HAMP domain-containing sensor histidine kinase [Sulfurospirillum arcachonense]
MIKFSKAISPFISLDNCGDFANYFECSDSYLICVGDIGGHGNIKIGNLHLEIEKIIEKNKDNSVLEIFNLVKKLEKVKQYGLTFFIGRVNKALPLLQYICIGNLKLELIKNGKIKPLKHQNGVIGLELPINIEQNVLKLHDNDILICSTDGVNSYENTLFSNIENTENIELLSQSIIDRYALKNDDALCCIVQYTGEGSESYHFTKNLQKSHLEQTKPVKQELNKKTYIKRAEKKDIQSTQQIVYKIENLFDLQSYIEPLEKKFLFVSFDSMTQTRNLLSQILRFLKFDIKQSVKIQTIVMEFLKNKSLNIDFYLSETSLQIHLVITKSLAQKVIPLFHEVEFSYDDTNGILLLQYPLSSHIDIQSEKLKDFKEMVFYGMSQENHKTYKKEQEYTTMVHQAKIAQMSEIISMIAHQWRQPLGSIASAIVNIQNKLALDKYDFSKEEDKTKFFKFLNTKLVNIAGYTDFLSKTIDDFRNFYKEGFNKDNFSLNEPIQSAISIIDASLKNNNIALELNLNDSIEISGLKNELMQVILNILKNAKDNFEDQSIDNQKIQIKTYEDNNSVFLSIKDNGGGIPKDTIDKIFEPYFSTKDKKNGTGLGLYMSKMIVEEHHKGKIRVINQENSAEFLISIPKEL